MNKGIWLNFFNLGVKMRKTGERITNNYIMYTNGYRTGDKD
jgi:hypothetical protein